MLAVVDPTADGVRNGLQDLVMAPAVGSLSSGADGKLVTPLSPQQKKMDGLVRTS